MPATLYLVYFLFVIIFSLIHLYIIKKNSVKNFLEIVVLWNEIAIILYFIYWAFEAKKNFYKHIGPASWVIIILYFIENIYEGKKWKKYFHPRATIKTIKQTKKKDNK